MGAERHAITLVVVSLEVFPEQPTVASAVATQQLQTERFVCSRRTAQGRLHITARRLAHHLRPTRLGDPQRRANSVALPRTILPATGGIPDSSARHWGASIPVVHTPCARSPSPLARRTPRSSYESTPVPPPKSSGLRKPMLHPTMVDSQNR